MNDIISNLSSTLINSIVLPIVLALLTPTIGKYVGSLNQGFRNKNLKIKCRSYAAIIYAGEKDTTLHEMMFSATSALIAIILQMLLFVLGLVGVSALVTTKIFDKVSNPIAHIDPVKIPLWIVAIYGIINFALYLIFVCGMIKVNRIMKFVRNRDKFKNEYRAMLNKINNEKPQSRS